MDDNKKEFQIDWNLVHSTIDLIRILRENQIPSNEHGRFVEEYQSIKAKEKGIPLHGLFELTPYCNLDCRMCYVHLEHDKLKKRHVLSVEWWKNIIRQAYDAGMRYASLSGGECLAYPGFKEIYLYLYDLGIRPVVKTNGILLGEDWITFFKKYPPRRFEISLYGCTEDGYERVTGHRVFNDIDRNLKLLKEAALPVSISITPSVYLYEEILGIIQIAESLQFSHTMNYGLFEPREETGREKCDLSIGQYIDLLKIIGKKNGVVFNPMEEDDKLPDFGIGNKPQYGITCGAGRNAFNITWEGNLRGCLNLEPLQSSLMNKSFTQAWEEVHQAALRLPMPMECIHCAYRSVCANCVAYHCTNGVTSHCNSNVCNRTKTMVREGIIKLSSVEI